MLSRFSSLLPSTNSLFQAKHAQGHHTFGVDGETGKVVDMKDYGVWEPEAVKLQSIKTAIEAACLLLRVDEICAAKGGSKGGAQQAPEQQEEIQQEGPEQ